MKFKFVLLISSLFLIANCSDKNDVKSITPSKGYYASETPSWISGFSISDINTDISDKSLNLSVFFNTSSIKTNSNISNIINPTTIDSNNIYEKASLHQVNKPTLSPNTIDIFYSKINKKNKQFEIELFSEVQTKSQCGYYKSLKDYQSNLKTLQLPANKKIIICGITATAHDQFLVQVDVIDNQQNIESSEHIFKTQSKDLFHSRQAQNISNDLIQNMSRNVKKLTQIKEPLFCLFNLGPHCKGIQVYIKSILDNDKELIQNTNLVNALNQIKQLKKSDYIYKITPTNTTNETSKTSSCLNFYEDDKKNNFKQISNIIIDSINVNDESKIQTNMAEKFKRLTSAYSNETITIESISDNYPNIKKYFKKMNINTDEIKIALSDYSKSPLSLFIAQTLNKKASTDTNIGSFIDPIAETINYTTKKVNIENIQNCSFEFNVSIASEKIDSIYNEYLNKTFGSYKFIHLNLTSSKYKDALYIELTIVHELRHLIDYYSENKIFSAYGQLFYNDDYQTHINNLKEIDHSKLIQESLKHPCTRNMQLTAKDTSSSVDQEYLNKLDPSYFDKRKVEALTYISNTELLTNRFTLLTEVRSNTEQAQYAKEQLNMSEEDYLTYMQTSFGYCLTEETIVFPGHQNILIIGTPGLSWFDAYIRENYNSEDIEKLTTTPDSFYKEI